MRRNFQYPPIDKNGELLQNAPPSISVWLTSTELQFSDSLIRKLMFSAHCELQPAGACEVSPHSPALCSVVKLHDFLRSNIEVGIPIKYVIFFFFFFKGSSCHLTVLLIPPAQADLFA